MKVYVGTSGWYYSWNPEKNFDWFIKNSKLNTIELNASFYHFPYPNQVKGWSNKGKDIRWSVKVNRLITHVRKFNKEAERYWNNFRKLFEPLDLYIDFYLFQLPPSLTPASAKRLESFIKKTKLKERFALEARNMEWFDNKWINWAKKLGITFVSVDSPEFPLDVFNTNGIVYERMHGRTAWYSHDYSDKELKEVANNIIKVKPKKVYVYFNNNHAMLINAQRMLKILRGVK